MNGKALFLHSLSPMHTGIGQAVDVVDLPIARERATNWPYVPGSTIKGVLRDACCVKNDDPTYLTFIAAFGPDTPDASDSAGMLLFCDAHLLCFPVRSFFRHICLGDLSECTAARESRSERR